MYDGEKKMPVEKKVFELDLRKDDVDLESTLFRAEWMVVCSKSISEYGLTRA